MSRERRPDAGGLERGMSAPANGVATIKLAKRKVHSHCVIIHTQSETIRHETARSTR